MASQIVWFDGEEYEVQYDYDSGEQATGISESIEIYKIFYWADAGYDNLLRQMSSCDMEEIEDAVWGEIDKE